ncbi:hypothetical protein [Vibrio sp. MEBiC08052]|uniref:hypothetical protein n=1 Tax=Vibrio sp. MEBiC08052 TaxID=1761910 RepID=UPI00074081D7|nr:hypothetical protein [Vibrio sp. MEBiC08052]KUI97418.1 hypothetical protein VRK_36070 [Vibrio sp. MEBiC08052]
MIDDMDKSHQINSNPSHEINKQQVPVCEVKTCRIESGEQLSDIIEGMIQGSAPHSLGVLPGIQTDDWLLWVEPIPKATAEKCPAMFTHHELSQLQDKLSQAWQFSEFFLLFVHHTVHGIQTRQGVLLKHVWLDDAVQQEAKQEIRRQPYLWHDTARFDDNLSWIAQVTESALVSQFRQLNFIECQDNTGCSEYVLGGNL